MGLEDRTGFGEKFDQAVRNGFAPPEKKPAEPVDTDLAGMAFKLGVLAGRGKLKQLTFDGPIDVKNLTHIPSSIKGHKIAAGVNFNSISRGHIEGGLQRGNELRAVDTLILLREWLAKAVYLYELYRETDIALLLVNGAETPFSDEALEDSWREEGYLPSVIAGDPANPVITAFLADSQPHASGSSPQNA